jgi:hypothetical protein
MATGDVILDTGTNLKWKREILSTQNYSMATNSCMLWGGRIPTEAELTAVIGPIRKCILMGTLTFHQPPINQGVWSSTPDPSNSTFDYVVYFDGTPPTPAPQIDGHWTWCVM